MNSSVKGGGETRSKKPRVWQKALGFFFFKEGFEGLIHRGFSLQATFQSRARVGVQVRSAR